MSDDDSYEAVELRHFARGARSAMSGLPDRHEWPRPIPVSERLPKDMSPVLAYSQDCVLPGWYAAMYVGMVDGITEERHWAVVDRDALIGEYALENVTHWLPLPPEPHDELRGGA